MHKRFIVVTGKGGVGKSTLALALAKYYKNLGKKVLLTTIGENIPDWAQSNQMPEWFKLELSQSATGYVGKKLGSQTLASWVCSTTFFKALLDMLPGFSFVIYLGHLMERLHEDENLILILDSPSSGHAITMFESCWNFKKVFGPGALGDDLDKVLNFLYKEDILSVIVTSLPGELPLMEGLELREQLRKLDIRSIHMVVNHCLGKWVELNHPQELPTSLKKKIELENESLESHVTDQMNYLPYVAELEGPQLINELSTHINGLQFIGNVP